MYGKIKRRKPLNSKNRKQKSSKALLGESLTVTLLVLTLALTLSAGCAKSKKLVIHPLENDFKLVTAGETVTAQKSGALVSDYWLSEVAGVEVE